MTTTTKVYFSDFFEVSPHLIEQYGALNISLINDLPLFVDPFLLFNSAIPEYKRLHEQMLEYLGFLRDEAVKVNGNIPNNLLRAWYSFPEIKQTWLGFSRNGNMGRGPGLEFARSLSGSLNGLFRDFDKSDVANPHIEKFCLIKEGIGRDNISDFTTNLIHEFLLDYTQTFCKEYINPKFLRKFSIRHVSFNYDTCSWKTKDFILPCFNGNYVLLTPKDILTKDENWINKKDLALNFLDVAASIPNEQLRAQLNHYFHSALPKRKTKTGKIKENSLSEKINAMSVVVQNFPEFLDYYLKYKEERSKEASAFASNKVNEVENIFVKQLPVLLNLLQQNTAFYDAVSNTREATYQRIMYLKDCIEKQGCYRIFYNKHKPVSNEVDLHIMFKLTWYGTRYDVNREVNNGTGPVDFKISNGALDMSLVEFKLASNTQLKKNLSNQLETYQKTNQTLCVKPHGFKVIVYFSEKEYDRVQKILEEIKKKDDPDIILIDARWDNKISASRTDSH